MAHPPQANDKGAYAIVTFHKLMRFLNDLDHILPLVIAPELASVQPGGTMLQRKSQLYMAKYHIGYHRVAFVSGSEIMQATPASVTCSGRCRGGARAKRCQAPKGWRTPTRYGC